MQNRMDKYSVNPKSIGSRTERNKDLYENVKNSSMKNYEIKSNVSVIDNDASSINVGKVRKMIDERYSDSSPKRKSIEIPEFNNAETEEKIQDTKEYDINAILAKAKVGKNVDYNKERLKKVRDTQYEILNNLDLELRREESHTKSKSQEDAENNLMNLINTITELEIKNKNIDSSDTSDLLNLTDDSDDITEPNKSIDYTNELTGQTKKHDCEVDSIKPIEESEDERTYNEIRLVRKSSATEKHEDKDEKELEDLKECKIIELNEESETEPTKDLNKDHDERKSEHSKKNDEHIEKTLSKLDISMSNYEDFADISKRDAGSLVIKVVIFIIIIVLVIGAIYILNDILNLGLF